MVSTGKKTSKHYNDDAGIWFYISLTSLITASLVFVLRREPILVIRQTIMVFGKFCAFTILVCLRTLQKKIKMNAKLIQHSF
jgi:hypothetical protein